MFFDPTVANPSLAFDGVTVSLKPDTPLFRDLNLQVTAQTPTLLFGPTGCGKSTLLKLAAGLRRPQEGTISLNHFPLSRAKAAVRDSARRHLGFLPQHPLWLEGGYCVLEQVMLPMLVCGTRMDKAQRRSLDLLNQLGLSPFIQENPRNLSGGEAQRVGLARAWVHRPDFLFLDEPTAHLDDASTGLLCDLLREEVVGKAVLLVASHDRRLKDSGIFPRWWDVAAHRSGAS